MVKTGLQLSAMSVEELENILNEAGDKLRSSEMIDSRYGLLWGTLAEKDARRALEIAAKQAPGSFQRMGISEGAKMLAGQDPAKLLLFADQQSDPKLADLIRKAAIPSLVGTAPAEAYRQSRSLDAPERRGMAQRTFSAWAGSDRADAESAAKEISDGYEQQQAWSGIAIAIAEKSPQESWQWVNSLRTDRQDTLRGVRTTLIQKWASTDPKGAVEAASKLENPAAREMLLSNLLLAWPKDDFSSAVEWVESIDDPVLRGSLAATSASRPDVPSDLAFIE